MKRGPPSSRTPDAVNSKIVEYRTPAPADAKRRRTHIVLFMAAIAAALAIASVIVWYLWHSSYVVRIPRSG